MAKPVFNSEFLNDYMTLVEDTESPRIFHLWSALFAVSSSLGRRCFLPFGDSYILANLYCIMVGTPGTRKSTAMHTSRKLITKATGVRFAPSDTGFQRQGLALALQGGTETDSGIMDAAVQATGETTISSLMDLQRITEEAAAAEEEAAKFIDSADRHHIAICASEFSRVIGQNNLSMMDFLGERYDGEDYLYKTKTSEINLKNTLINMMACTTPTSLSTSLPPQAGGQGFLSRIILVYGARKYRQIARPLPSDDALKHKIINKLSNIYYGMNGPFTETPDAVKHCEDLYSYQMETTDSRFGYYQERRFTHLMKLAMWLAASRCDKTIVKEDYEEAHRILRATERGMPDALGEFGMNPLAQLKQEILEQLRAAQGPLAMEQVVNMFHRDAKSREILEVINDLVRAGAILVAQLETGKRMLSAVYKKASTEDDMMNLLAES